MPRQPSVLVLLIILAGCEPPGGQAERDIDFARVRVGNLPDDDRAAAAGLAATLAGRYGADADTVLGMGDGLLRVTFARSPFAPRLDAQCAAHAVPREAVLPAARAVWAAFGGRDGITRVTLIARAAETRTRWFGRTTPCTGEAEYHFTAEDFATDAEPEDDPEHE